jgi:hypothetical protein
LHFSLLSASVRCAICLLLCCPSSVSLLPSYLSVLCYSELVISEATANSCAQAAAAALKHEAKCCCTRCRLMQVYLQAANNACICIQLVHPSIRNRWSYDCWRKTIHNIEYQMLNACLGITKGLYDTLYSYARALTSAVVSAALSCMIACCVHCEV